MDKWSDIWWNDSNEFNKLYCKSSNHVGIPLSQTCRNHFWGLQSWVPNCPISEQKTRDPIGSWILFLGVCPNVHQPSTEESDIWHHVTSKKHVTFFLCVEEKCRFLEGNNKKKRKTRHEQRRTLMYSSTCFAASKPKLTACGVRSPGILGSIMALWQFQHHSLYHSPNHERPSCPKNVASVFL